MTKIFVYQDWPSRSEVEWTDRFGAVLRESGFDVFQEWTLPKPPPQDAVEAALKASDVIVFLLTHPGSLVSPSLYFNIGVAAFGNKRIITVISRGINQERISPLELRETTIVKSSARRTAEEVAARLRELDQRNVA